MISQIIEFSGDINCAYVCRTWNNIIKNNNIKLYKFNYTEWLPNEILSIVFEHSENLNCRYVSKKWKDVISADFKLNCVKCNTICSKHVITTCSLCKLLVYSHAINVLLISGGSACLRYSC
jgi:hypothetical protein